MAVTLVKFLINLYFMILNNHIKIEKDQYILQLSSGKDRQTDGWMDMQLFGGYHKIPHHFLWQGINIRQYSIYWINKSEQNSNDKI